MESPLFSDMEVEGEQIVKEADGEDAVVEGDVVEELPKEAETIPRHATGHLIQPPGISDLIISLSQFVCIVFLCRPGCWSTIFRCLIAATSVSKRNAIKPTRWNRWPNNIMSYEIDMDPPMSELRVDCLLKSLFIMMVTQDYGLMKTVLSIFFPFAM